MLASATIMAMTRVGAMNNKTLRRQRFLRFGKIEIWNGNVAYGGVVVMPDGCELVRNLALGNINVSKKVKHLLIREIR